MIGTFEWMSTRFPDCLKNTETPNSTAIKPRKDLESSRPTVEHGPCPVARTLGDAGGDAQRQRRGSARRLRYGPRQLRTPGRYSASLWRASLLGLLLPGFPPGMAGQAVSISGQIRPRLEMHTAPVRPSYELTTMRLRIRVEARPEPPIRTVAGSGTSTPCAASTPARP